MQKIAWLLALSLVCSFTSEAQASSRKQYGGSVTLPFGKEMGSSDPVRIDSVEAWLWARQLHETLYRRLGRERYLPALASEEPRISGDGKSWTIRLRAGLRFHDGSTVDSHVIVRSWQRLLHPSSKSPHWWLLAPVKGAIEYHMGKRTKVAGLEVVNDLEFRISLRAPMPAFMEALAALPTAPLPRRVLRAEGSTEHPPGCGPFRLKEGDPAGSLVMLPFMRHPHGRPYLDELRWVHYSSAREASLAFELGKLHLSPNMPRSLNADQRLIDTLLNRKVFLGVNPKRVEQFPGGFVDTIHQSIDRRSLVAYLVGARGRPLGEVLLRHDGMDEDLLQPAPEKAKAYVKRLLIQQVGLSPVLEFIIPAKDPFAKAVAERVQLNLQEVGLSVQIVTVPAASMAERVLSGKFDLRLIRPLPLVGNTEFQLLAMVARLKGPSDVGQAFDALFDIPEEKARQELARERAKRMMQKGHWIPLMAYGDRWVIQPGIHEVRSQGQGLLDFANVWFGR